MFYLGIDVAKTKLDTLLLDVASGKQKSKVVANSVDGINGLLKSLANRGLTPDKLHVILEPTGSYHEAAALALVEAGCTVSLVNPLHARRYAQSLGLRSKTDGMDAAVLARFGAAEKPVAWIPPSPSARALRALLSRRDAVAEDLQREKNRLEKSAEHTPAVVVESIQQGIVFLQKQLDALQRQISDHIDGDPELREKRTLLLTIPGVGPRVAEHMSALLTSHPFTTAEQLAAYLGLVPVEWQSGSSIKGRPHLSKAGPAHLRRLLYLPALVASKYNPHVRATYERLISRGTSKMSALGAAMRKLAHLCFGVVHSKTPYRSVYTTR